jgi:hypothetical protein
MNVTLVQSIDNFDWSIYEDEVINAAKQAVDNYCFLFASALEERVYQVALWTDAHTLTTAVSFETKDHAKAFVEKWAQYWRNEGDDEIARELEDQGYTTNPANFKHRQFFSVEHLSLDFIKAGDNLDNDFRRLVEAHMEASLLNVVKTLLAEGMLDKLPQEDGVWIGISSPTDWYSHVIKTR